MSGAGSHSCHRAVWLRGAEDEARKIWDLGKEFGVTACGDEGVVLSKLVDMEHRDALEAGDLAGAESRRGDAGVQ